MATGTIHATVSQYVQALREAELPVSAVVLAGSYAAGTPHEWSDIDLVIVSPAFDASDHWGSVELLWRTAATVDSRIEPIACGLKEWEEGGGGMIVAEARRHGIAIEP
ncbi:MAG: nucleotidyltransferase domain-containing protein [Candidatus Hydrogenedentes bacterium]|nr:nucleotidyltransferase domain-containing protein [Candidatus Hydrogenedentota bacterium]